MNLYDFTVKAMDGSDVSLADYRGKVALVVNTATGCGFTPQYEPLQKLYDAHRDDAFAILDFPCDQFGHQAPGDDDTIHTFCTGRFGITFPQFSKVEVNGENAIPLYRWLTESTTFGGFSGPMGKLLEGVAEKMDPDFRSNGSIKWNFTKFLIGKDGEIVRRFEPTDDMDEVRAQVEALLSEG